MQKYLRRLDVCNGRTKQRRVLPRVEHHHHVAIDWREFADLIQLWRPHSRSLERGQRQMRRGRKTRQSILHSAHIV